MILTMHRAFVRRCAPALILLLALAVWIESPAWSQQAAPPAERYAGEARLGDQPPIPVHLEIRRSNEVVSGVISSEEAAFTLEEGVGTDVVTAVLGGPGGGPIVLRFAGGRVEGEFRLGDQDGTLQAAITPLGAAAFFAEPEQRLDLGPAEWREDLDRLIEILTTRHGAPFHRTSRETFEREVERIRGALPRLSGPQAAVELRKLTAMIGDGHTSLAVAKGRPRLPIETYWFEDGIRLVGIADEHRELLGAKLIAIEGIAVADAVRRLRPYVPQGESAWSYRYVAPWLFAEPDVLADARIGEGASRSFTFETMDGGTHRISLEAATGRVSRAIIGGARPFWEQAPDEGFRLVPLPDGSLYVNWRSYEGLPEQASILLAELERRRPPHLLIDFRDSGGGDFNLGRNLIRQLAALPWLNRPDRLFVLTGRRTFSAAMTNAVDFRKMTRATLIGEPPGAAPNNWQEVRFFHLPNSGLRVGVSTLYYEFLPGEQAVRPDLFIPPTPADWGSEYDAAVRYILGLPCPGID